MGTIFVDATHAAKTGARTGAQTVVRGLLSGLSQCAVDFQIMRWSKWRDRLLPLTPKENHRLAVIQLGERVRPPSPAGSWLLLPEIIYGDRALRVMHYARRRKFRVAAIFHDAIPISHPHLVHHEAVKWHAHYMKALCGADLVIAVSDFALESGIRHFDSRARTAKANRIARARAKTDLSHSGDQGFSAVAKPGPAASQITRTRAAASGAIAQMPPKDELIRRSYAR
jgi:hypothetical protein